VEAYCTEHVAQKARREAEAKAKEDAKKTKDCKGEGEVEVHPMTLE